MASLKSTTIKPISNDITDILTIKKFNDDTLFNLSNNNLYIDAITNITSGLTVNNLEVKNNLLVKGSTTLEDSLTFTDGGSSIAIKENNSNKVLISKNNFRWNDYVDFSGSTITIGTSGSPATLKINGTTFDQHIANAKDDIYNHIKVAYTSGENSKYVKGYTYTSAGGLVVNREEFDNALNTTSTNAPQTKIVKSAVDTLTSKDTDLQNQINEMQRESYQGSLANRIKALETKKIRYRSISNGDRLDQSPWNSGTWMLIGASNVSIRLGSSSYTSFYCPFIFSNATAGSQTSEYHPGYYSTVNTSHGSNSVWHDGYTSYEINGSIYINGSKVDLSYYSSSGAATTNLGPTIYFNGSNVIALQVDIQSL